MYTLSQLTCQKKISQLELNKTDSVSATSLIKIRKQLNNTCNHLKTDQIENQSKAIDNIEFDKCLHFSTEIPPTTEYEPKGNNQNDSQIQSPTLSQDWWQASCQIGCISCKVQVLTEETSIETTCYECSQEQYVVRTGSHKQDSDQCSFVEMNKRYTECCVCKSDIMRIPCCNLFQPIQLLAKICLSA